MTTTAFGCVKNAIRLRSGKWLDLASPQPEQMTFADIAGGLSKLCRFGGQCERFYSVAEHSYHCAIQAKRDKLPTKDQVGLLLHDAAEAFIGDVVKPLKIMLPEYSDVESRMGECIARKFNITTLVTTVKGIDKAMLIAERHAMFTSDNVLWTGESEVRRLSVDFKWWGCAEAEEMFVIRARELGVDVTC